MLASEFAMTPPTAGRRGENAFWEHQQICPGRDTCARGFRGGIGAEGDRGQVSRREGLPKDLGPEVAAAFRNVLERRPSGLQNLVQWGPFWAFHRGDGPGGSASRVVRCIRLSPDTGATTWVNGSGLPDCEPAACRTLD